MTRLARLAERAVQRHIPSGSNVLVATSGGPDSQALLSVLAGLGLSLTAAGIDHGLRPEAHRELDLAEALATRLKVPFVRESVQVAAGNLPAQARKARYAALTRIADARGCHFIAVGHTATDQLETLLLGLLRSDGVGLRLGMPALRGRVLRPLLDARRFDVLAHLRTHGITFAEDPSNSDSRRSRARLRSEVLPVLRAMNPRIETTIGPWLADRAEDELLLGRAAARLLAPAATDAERRVGPLAPSLAVQPLLAAPLTLRRRALRTWLTGSGVVPSRRLIDRLITALPKAKCRVIAAEGTFYVAGGALWTETGTNYALTLPIPGEVALPNSLARIVARLDEAPSGGYGAILGSRLAARVVALDADGLHSSFTVRAWQPGDRLMPFGHEATGGSVKVGDLFTNAKIPRVLRAGWPIVGHGDSIVWVVGLRRASCAPITSRTHRVVTLEVLV